jgi:hypothetical protein
MLPLKHKAPAAHAVTIAGPKGRLNPSALEIAINRQARQTMEYRLPPGAVYFVGAAEAGGSVLEPVSS